MAGKRLVLMPGAYDALSARIIEAEGFEALVAGGYAGVGSMLAQADMGQSNMRDYADHYGRICAAVESRSMSTPIPASAASTMYGRWCAPSRPRGSRACSSATRCFRTAVVTCRVSRSCRSSNARQDQGRLDARRDPDLFIAARTDAAGVEGVEAAIARCQLFMEAGADMAKPMGVDTIAEIKRVLREVGGPHMATLSQAAGPKARSLEELEAAGVAPRPSLGRAVRGGERGAQRAAPAQARQLARAVPGASHPARRLLRPGRLEAAARARGELRQGRGGTGAEARGRIRGPTECVLPQNGAAAGSRLSAWGRRLPGMRRTSAQDFYKNKQIRMIVGHGVGNDYDLAGRLLARYLAKHIPGSRPSSCRTCRRRRASPRPIFFTPRRRATAPCSARSRATSRARR